MVGEAGPAIVEEVGEGFLAHEHAIHGLAATGIPRELGTLGPRQASQVRLPFV